LDSRGSCGFVSLAGLFRVKKVRGGSYSPNRSDVWGRTSRMKKSLRVPTHSDGGSIHHALDGRHPRPTEGLAGRRPLRAVLGHFSGARKAGFCFRRASGLHRLLLISSFISARKTKKTKKKSPSSVEALRGNGHQFV